MKTKSPRLSVNKLAEYMNADTLRRRQIVKDAKYPKSFKDTRYADARTGIKDYIIGGYDENIIGDIIRTLKQRPDGTDFQNNDIKNSIASLGHILSTELPNFENCTLQEFDGENTLINIEGLNISVYPDIIIKRNDNGKIGGLKIHLSKTYDLGDGLIYVSTLMKYFFINCGYEENIIDDKLCVSVDVFRMKYEFSPKSYKRTIQRLSAACQEIVLWWDKV